MTSKSDDMVMLISVANFSRTLVTKQELFEIAGLKPVNAKLYMKRMSYLESIDCYVAEPKLSRKDFNYLMNKIKKDDEQWMTIEAKGLVFNNLEISNYGRIRKPTKNGYCFLRAYENSAKCIVFNAIHENGKRYALNIPRVVAKTFLYGRTKEKNYVVHKNGDRMDNTVANLEWVTMRDRNKYNVIITNYLIKKIDIETGEELDEYETIIEAAKDNYIRSESISKCLNNKQETAAGFKWKKEMLA